MIKISQRKDRDITILDVEGTYDIEAQNLINEFITNKPEHFNENLLWNFKEVSSISSSGVAILLNACTEIKKQGRITNLFNVRPEVLEVFQLHKVLPILNIYPDENAAKRQVQLEAEKKGQAYIRLFERINVNLKAKFKIFKKGRLSGIHRFQNAEAKSLSMCGIFLHTKNTCSANTLLETKLLLPNGFIKPHIKFLGKVVWVAEKEKHSNLYPGMALCTLFMEEKEKSNLEEFLKQQGA
jgi:anti-anti-sigma factor